VHVVGLHHPPHRDVGLALSLFAHVILQVKTDSTSMSICGLVIGMFGGLLVPVGGARVRVRAWRSLGWLPGSGGPSLRGVDQPGECQPYRDRKRHVEIFTLVHRDAALPRLLHLNDRHQVVVELLVLDLHAAVHEVVVPERDGELLSRLLTHGPFAPRPRFPIFTFELYCLAELEGVRTTGFPFVDIFRRRAARDEQEREHRGVSRDLRRRRRPHRRRRRARVVSKNEDERRKSGGLSQLHSSPKNQLLT
jgi:hypothetical protein